MSRVNVFIPEKYKDEKVYHHQGKNIYKNLIERDRNDYISVAIDKSYVEHEDGTYVYECIISLERAEYELLYVEGYPELNEKSDDTLYLELCDDSYGALLNHLINIGIDKLLCYDFDTKCKRWFRYKEIITKDERGKTRKLIEEEIVNGWYHLGNIIYHSQDYSGLSKKYLYFSYPEEWNMFKSIKIHKLGSENVVLNRILWMSKEELWDFLLSRITKDEIYNIYNYDIEFAEATISVGDFLSEWNTAEYYVIQDKIIYDLKYFLLIDKVSEEQFSHDEFKRRYIRLLEQARVGRLSNIINKGLMLDLIHRRDNTHAGL